MLNRVLAPTLQAPRIWGFWTVSTFWCVCTCMCVFVKVNLTQRRISHFRAYSSGAFSVSTVLYNHTHLVLYPVPQHSPQREISGTQSPLPFPQPLATASLLSISMDWSTLNISCEWTHRTRGLLCLASLTQYQVFEVHPYGSMFNALLLFCDWILFHCTAVPCFVYPFLTRYILH